MQVRGAHAECIQQHLVQELDDWRVFDFRDGSRLTVGQPIGGGFVKLELAADDLFHRLAGGGRVGLDQLEQLVVFGDHPVDAELGCELDLLHRLLIGRIGRGDCKPVIALAEYHHAIGLADLAVQQALWQPLGVQGIEVNQRRGKSRRHGMRQVGRGYGTGAG